MGRVYKYGNIYIYNYIYTSTVISHIIYIYIWTRELGCSIWIIWLATVINQLLLGSRTHEAYEPATQGDKPDIGLWIKDRDRTPKSSTPCRLDHLVSLKTLSPTPAQNTARWPIHRPTPWVPSANFGPSGNCTETTVSWKIFKECSNKKKNQTLESTYKTTNTYVFFLEKNNAQ